MCLWQDKHMAVHYYSHRHTHDHRSDRAWSLNHATEAVWYLAYIIVGILLIRFGLRLLGANPLAPFAQFMYSVSDILLLPFRQILPAVREGRSVLEWATLVAMAVYWLLAWAVQKILLLALPVRERHREL